MRIREFAAPLQALLFIFMCFGLIWMLYAMAFFDPTPPTAAEINSQVTHDPEINDMRTAAALTVNALFGFGPTQIWLATPTLILSPTDTATVISIANTITPRPATDTPTAGIEPTITDDRSRDDDPIPPTPTFTLRPTHTATPRPPTLTPTPRPPTQTNTPVPPTPTSVPPTSIPPTSVSPTSVPPTSVPPTSVPPTAGETADPTEEPAATAASGGTPSSP